MKLYHLRNVIAVVERGSLRAGAKHLGLATPAMSRSIRELEQELGVVLFERGKFGMRLTTAGEVFVRRAKSVQAEFQRTIDEMERFRGEEKGTITVAFGGATLLSLVPAIFKHFHRRYPHVGLKILEGTFTTLEPDIRDGLVDLYYGPIIRGFIDPALIVESLFTSRLMVIARKGHSMERATTAAELAGAAWAIPPVMIDTDNVMTTIFKTAGLASPKVVAQAASSMAMSTIVASSDVLALVPEQWMEILQSTSLLVRIPVHEFAGAHVICSVRRANMPLVPAAEYVNDLALRSAAVLARAEPDHRP